jgi:lantibiotic leader peptide-processing serine protease
MMKRLSLMVLAGLFVVAGCTDHPTQAVDPVGPSPGSDLAMSSSAVAGLGALETTGNHIVMMRNQRIPNNFARDVENLGGTIETAFGTLGVAVVSGLSGDAVAALEGLNGVSMVSPDYLIPLELPTDIQASEVSATDLIQNDNPETAFFFPRQWNMRVIEADVAWAAGRTGSPGVTVAILDTGLDYNHVDLQGLVDLDRSASFVPSDDALVQAFFPGAHPVADLHYHGTHVGATVSSNALAAAGVTSKVTLVGVKVCSVSGSCPTSGVLAGIMYAADIGADVMNLSLGGLFLKSANPGFVSVINRAITHANRAGSVVVVAAGNAGFDLDRNQSPEGDRFPSLFASYCDGPTTVCVSATGPVSGGVTGPWIDQDAPADYTNFGRSAIDVAAPGGTGGGPVWAACSSFSLQIPACQAGGFIVGLGGTSMAAPHVAGVAALLVEDLGANRAGLVRQRLHQTADKVGGNGNHPFYGKGRVNAATAAGVN